MLHIIRLFFSPILSFFIFMTGSSLLISLLSLIFNNRHVSVYGTAALTFAYYVGYVLSAIHVEKFISRVGFVRAHSTFATLATLATLLHLFWFQPLWWIALRFIYGVGLAGLCLTTQNWFLHSDKTGDMRGRMLAIYMVTMYCSQSFGQYLLTFMDIQTIIPFCVVAFLTSLCVMPVSLTRTTAPACEQHTIFGLRTVFKISPVGTFGGFCSGILMGCIYGIFPITLQEWQHPLSEISTVMAIVIIGGMLLQYPIGRLADHYERRKILITLILSCLLCTLLGLWCHYKNWFILFLLVTLIWGGLIFTIYPVSINLACDRVQHHNLLSTTGGLMISYSIGASIGPFLGAAFMHLFGAPGFYILFVTVLCYLTYFVLTHIKKRPPVAIEHQKTYIGLPSGVALSLSRIFAHFKHKNAKK